MIFIDKNNYDSLDINNQNLVGKMDENLKKSYYEIYAIYYSFLLEFLLKNTLIKDIDEKIANSILEFVPLTEEKMDIYQYLSSDSLKYFYIRNNMNVEFLNSDERAFLTDKLLKNDFVYNEQVEAFIKSTFQKVIFEPIATNGKPLFINYGPISESFFALNGSLVIGVHYDEFNYNGQTDAEWSERYEKQKELLFTIMEELEQNIKDKLKVACSVIKYDDYSIKKKGNIDLYREKK